MPLNCRMVNDMQTFTPHWPYQHPTSTFASASLVYP